MPQASTIASPTAASLRAVPPRFACNWKEGGSGAAWVHVAGELDLATAPALRYALRDAQLYARMVVLDLRELTFLESAGVHVILDAAAKVRRGDGRLILVRGPTHVDRALTLTGASSQVLIVDLDPTEPPTLTLLRSAATTAERSAPEDDQLMERVKRGSVEAFEELYDRYCDRAYRVAWSACHDSGRSEDAVQEAFLSIWNASANYSPTRGSVAAWLLTAVRYRAIDISRRDRKHSERRAPEQAIDLHHAPENIAEQVVTRDEARRLRLLAQLPDAQQEVITLAFYGGLSHTEIAGTLDLPAGTVKGRMRLGLNALRTDIQQDAA